MSGKEKPISPGEGPTQCFGVWLGKAKGDNNTFYYKLTYDLSLAILSFEFKVSQEQYYYISTQTVKSNQLCI